MNEERFYIIPQSDQWSSLFEGDKPKEVTIIDRQTKCPVELMNGISLDTIPYDMGINLADTLNWLEMRRIEEEMQ